MSSNVSLPACVGDPLRWVSPFGGCHTYAGSPNRDYCLVDTSQGDDIAAYQVCSECGLCTPVIPVQPSFPPDLTSDFPPTVTLSNEAESTLILVATLVPSFLLCIGLLYGCWVLKRSDNTEAGTRRGSRGVLVALRGRMLARRAAVAGGRVAALTVTRTGTAVRNHGLGPRTTTA